MQPLQAWITSSLNSGRAPMTKDKLVAALRHDKDMSHIKSTSVGPCLSQLRRAGFVKEDFDTGLITLVKKYQPDSEEDRAQYYQRRSLTPRTKRRFSRKASSGSKKIGLVLPIGEEMVTVTMAEAKSLFTQLGEFFNQ